MEWTVTPGGTWQLWLDGRVVAAAWESLAGLGYWVFAGLPGGAATASLDDAKDAAWAAVYRSTR